MQKCTIYHTGIDSIEDGFIKDNKVYFSNEDNNLYFPEEIFLASEECEGGLIQFEVNGKWGFANINTGEIVIKPIWDYAGAFYKGYARVALGAHVEIRTGYYEDIVGGKHGYIDTNGTIVIPLIYDYALDIPYKKHFKVSRNGKWGLIDKNNRILIPLKWNYLETSYEHSLIFCAIESSSEINVKSRDKSLGEIYDTQAKSKLQNTLKWGIYDKNFNLIIQLELDEAPITPKIKIKERCDAFLLYEEYFILKRANKYGLICNDGRLITNIDLSKEEVVSMLNEVSGRISNDLYF